LFLVVCGPAFCSFCSFVSFVSVPGSLRSSFSVVLRSFVSFRFRSFTVSALFVCSSATTCFHHCRFTVCGFVRSSGYLHRCSTFCSVLFVFVSLRFISFVHHLPFLRSFLPPGSFYVLLLLPLRFVCSFSFRFVRFFCSPPPFLEILVHVRFVWFTFLFFLPLFSVLVLVCSILFVRFVRSYRSYRSPGCFGHRSLFSRFGSAFYTYTAVTFVVVRSFAISFVSLRFVLRSCCISFVSLVPVSTFVTASFCSFVRSFVLHRSFRSFVLRFYVPFGRSSFSFVLRSRSFVPGYVCSTLPSLFFVRLVTFYTSFRCSRSFPLCSFHLVRSTVLPPFVFTRLFRYVSPFYFVPRFLPFTTVFCRYHRFVRFCYACGSRLDVFCSAPFFHHRSSFTFVPAPHFRRFRSTFLRSCVTVLVVFLPPLLVHHRSFWTFRSPLQRRFLYRSRSFWRPFYRSFRSFVRSFCVPPPFHHRSPFVWVFFRFLDFWISWVCVSFRSPFRFLPFLLVSPFVSWVLPSFHSFSTAFVASFYVYLLHRLFCSFRFVSTVTPRSPFSVRFLFPSGRSRFFVRFRSRSSCVFGSFTVFLPFTTVLLLLYVSFRLFVRSGFRSLSFLLFRSFTVAFRYRSYSFSSFFVRYVLHSFRSLHSYVLRSGCSCSFYVRSFPTVYRLFTVHRLFHHISRAFRFPGNFVLVFLRFRLRSFRFRWFVHVRCFRSTWRRFHTLRFLPFRFHRIAIHLFVPFVRHVPFCSTCHLIVSPHLPTFVHFPFLLFYTTCCSAFPFSVHHRFCSSFLPFCFSTTTCLAFSVAFVSAVLRYRFRSSSFVVFCYWSRSVLRSRCVRSAWLISPDLFGCSFSAVSFCSFTFTVSFLFLVTFWISFVRSFSFSAFLPFRLFPTFLSFVVRSFSSLWISGHVCSFFRFTRFSFVSPFVPALRFTIPTFVHSFSDLFVHVVRFLRCSFYVSSVLGVPGTFRFHHRYSSYRCRSFHSTVPYVGRSFISFRSPFCFHIRTTWSCSFVSGFLVRSVCSEFVFLYFHVSISPFSSVRFCSFFCSLRSYVRLRFWFHRFYLVSVVSTSPFRSFLPVHFVSRSVQFVRFPTTFSFHSFVRSFVGSPFLRFVHVALRSTFVRSRLVVLRFLPFWIRSLPFLRYCFHLVLPFCSSAFTWVLSCRSCVLLRSFLRSEFRFTV